MRTEFPQPWRVYISITYIEKHNKERIWHFWTPLFESLTVVSFWPYLGGSSRASGEAGLDLIILVAFRVLQVMFWGSGVHGRHLRHTQRATEFLCPFPGDSPDSNQPNALFGASYVTIFWCWLIPTRRKGKDFNQFVIVWAIFFSFSS